MCLNCSRSWLRPCSELPSEPSEEEKLKFLLFFITWAKAAEVLNAVNPSRGRFSLDIQENVFPRGSSGSPGPWSQHQAYLSSRSIWTTLKHRLEFLGCFVQSQELVILMDPFQLSVFYDSWLNSPGDDSKVCSYFNGYC